MRNATALLIALTFAMRSSTVRAASPAAPLKDWLARPADQRPPLADQAFATAPLSKTDAAVAKELLWQDHVAAVRRDRTKEWDDNAITIGPDTLKLLVKRFGTKPAGGWNLFLSLHGGGNAPPALNDSQWRNQIRLYSPPNSVVVAPRAPSNDWDLWHQPPVDALLDRLIGDAIVLADVDPDRVYLMGYSAGGDGVYQLAPRMADRFAAASMMAGHPNDASPLGLRDLPFAIHVGALDDGYHRNDVAKQWGQKLDDLRAGDPSGYVHLVKLHEGKHHWMDLEDAEALPWMMQYTRDPRPTKVVWMQGRATHDRFYWLATPAGQAKAGQLAVVSRVGQTFTVEKVDGGLQKLTVLFDDQLADLDQPVTVTMNGKPLFAATVRRTVRDLAASLADRGDPNLMYPASVTVSVGG